MMKKWSAIEWSLFILACTIPFTLLLSFLARFVSGQTADPESAKLLADILKIISGGIFGVIAGVGIRKKNDKS